MKHFFLALVASIVATTSAQAATPAVPPPALTSTSISQAGGTVFSDTLIRNRTKLLRYHRKMYSIVQGYQTLRGTVTCSTSSTAITGTNTKFTRDLFVGAKTMQANGSTLMGYVASITDDTHANFLANCAVNQTSLAATTVPSLVWMVWGDSTGPKIARNVMPKIARSIGQNGTVGTPGLSISGQTIDATTGTITTPNGSTVPYDYTYWPTGDAITIGASSSINYGVGGGVYTGNLFKVYYVQGPAFTSGSVTINLIDGSGTVQSTQTVNPNNATVQLGIATFNLGGSPVARRVQIVTPAGVTFVPLAILFRNTTVGGLLPFGLNRGGLGMDNVLSTANPALYQGVIADMKPDFATFQMRNNNSASTAANLAAMMPALNASYSDMDWLMYGMTPGIADAGYTAATAPDNIINTTIYRPYAEANNYAYFDQYTPLGSYETIIGLDPSFDGQHVATEFDEYEGSLVDYQFGLTAFLTAKAAPAAINSGTVRGQVLKVNKAQDNGFTTDAGQFDTDTFGFDVYAALNRWFVLSDNSGSHTNRSGIFSSNVNYGIGAIINGGNFGNTSGNYNNRDWSIQVNASYPVVTTSYKDASGNFIARTTAGLVTVAQLSNFTSATYADGSRLTVTDSTSAYSSSLIGTAPVGGGTNKVPVIMLGGSWVVE
jgi:hypothetical protein